MTVYLMALTTANLLMFTFYILPDSLLRLLNTSNGFKNGVCMITSFIGSVGLGVYLALLLSLLVDRWLYAMMKRYPGTCIVKLASKICSIYAARLITCICFAVSILAHAFIFFSEKEFYYNAFCGVDPESSVAYWWWITKQFAVRLLPLILILITCLAFLGLCCAPSRPAGYTLTDAGMKEELLDEKSERRLVVIVLISAVLSLLIHGALDMGIFHGIIDLAILIYSLIFPLLYLLVVSEYRQQLVNLFKRDRKKEGEEKSLLQMKQP